MKYLIKLADGYNAKYKSYINSPFYMSSSIIGNYKDEEGYIGPKGGGGIAYDKKTAILKSFSEAIERRSLLFGSTNINGESLAINLKNLQKKQIDHNLTKYNDSNPVVDTTGTAVHYNSDTAVYNALTELLEKNAIFLFWYGKKAYQLNSLNKSPYYYGLDDEVFNFKYYVQDFFNPLLVVICICEDTINNIVHFGVGSSLDLNEAVEKAQSELVLLKKNRELEMIYNTSSPRENHINVYHQIIKYLKEFESSDIYSNSDFKKYEKKMNYYDKIDILIKELPEWIEELYLTILNQKAFAKLISVKISSPQLITCLPIKRNLNLDLTVNFKTLNLNQLDLNLLPDCPIV